MKKKILAMILSIAMAVTLIPVGSFAVESIDNDENVATEENEQEMFEEEKYEDGEEIVEAMAQARESGDKITNKERNEIIEEASPEAVAEFSQIAIEEANEVCEEEDFTLESNESEKKDVYNLECGAQLIIEQEVEKVDDLGDVMASIFCENAYAAYTRTDYEGWKKYGTYNYKAVRKLWGGGVVCFKMWEKVTYKINKNGLTLTAHNADYEDGWCIDGIKCSSKLEDSTASKAGQDINALGRYKYKVTLMNTSFAMGTFYKRLRAYVKLESLDKNNKKAKVKHHMKFWNTDSYDW